MPILFLQNEPIWYNKEWPKKLYSVYLYQWRELKKGVKLQQRVSKWHHLTSYTDNTTSCGSSQKVVEFIILSSQACGSTCDCSKDSTCTSQGNSRTNIGSQCGHVSLGFGVHQYIIGRYDKSCKRRKDIYESDILGAMIEYWLWQRGCGFSDKKEDFGILEKYGKKTIMSLILFKIVWINIW